jgi:hypothetical protein
MLTGGIKTYELVYRLLKSFYKENVQIAPSCLLIEYTDGGVGSMYYA